MKTNPKTIKDILEKAREQSFYKFKAGNDRALELHQEDIEHFIISEMKGILAGLRGEKRDRNKPADEDIAMDYGYNKRETQLREDIDKIINK